MNVRRTSRRRFLKQSAAGASVLALGAALHPLAYAAEPEEKWIELFDGKTLEGWHKNPQRIGHGTGGQWEVIDGIITGQQDPPGSGNGGILLTDRKFGDFELVIDMMPDWGVDSGLFVRGNDRGQCFQMMVDYHQAGNVGHLYGEGTGGFNTRTFDINGNLDSRGQLESLTTANAKKPDDVGLLASCTPDEWLKAWKVGDWNTARVRVVGKYPHITTWINDLLVCDFDGDKAATPGYDKEKVFESLSEQGSIAVQVHGGTGAWPKGAVCRWKNVRVREL